MTPFLKPSDGNNFLEHHNYPHGEEVTQAIESRDAKNIYFKGIVHNDNECVGFRTTHNHTYLHTSYYVGVDWIVPQEKAIYIEPKLNAGSNQTNYLEMLFIALKQPVDTKYFEELFEIKWKESPIAITQDKDLLTPLLVVIYLKLVKEIVRKGLKKSYYRVEKNLYSRVKGKVLIGETIKENILKNKTLHTWCGYEEFGLNGLENRMLKKALVFIKRYLPTIKSLHADKYTNELFNYINPAFEQVSEDVSLHDVRHTKNNAFFKEYAEALRIAKIILQRFGYNITNASSQKMNTPPFWIDMSKLFEFYVLGKLKAAGYAVIYQKGMGFDIPDYLLKSEQLILDAKYKTYYLDDGMNESVAADIRQLSGYGRNEKIREYFGISDEKQPKLMVIFPNQTKPDEIAKGVLFTQGRPIPNYYMMRKISVALPTITSK